MQLNNNKTEEYNNVEIPKAKKNRCCSIPIIIVTVLIIILAIISTLITIYFLYFKRESFDNLSALNKARKENNQDGVKDGGEVPDAILSAERNWDQYIQDVKLVDLGTIYDTCNGTRKTPVGKVVLVNKDGKTSTKSIFNLTVENELTSGRMYMKTVLNTFHLYTKKWSLCTGDEKPDVRKMTLDCPVSKGYHSFSHIRNLPSFAPKGKYTVTSWATDQDDNIIMCGVAVLFL